INTKIVLILIGIVLFMTNLKYYISQAVAVILSPDKGGSLLARCVSAGYRVIYLRALIRAKESVAPLGLEPLFRLIPALTHRAKGLSPLSGLKILALTHRASKLSPLSGLMILALTHQAHGYWTSEVLLSY